MPDSKTQLGTRPAAFENLRAERAWLEFTDHAAKLDDMRKGALDRNYFKHVGRRPVPSRRPDEGDEMIELRAVHVDLKNGRYLSDAEVAAREEAARNLPSI